MSKSQYRDLIAWQKSRALASQIYRLTQAFPRSEMFGLTQQMRRAAVSVVSNIAEGHGRFSPADITRFLVIARGSTFEIESQTVIATDLGYLNQAHSEQLLEAIIEVTRLINGLLRHYEKKTC
jgi:four helix bundle protein